MLSNWKNSNTGTSEKLKIESKYGLGNHINFGRSLNVETAKKLRKTVILEAVKSFLKAEKLNWNVDWENYVKFGESWKIEKA